MLARRCTVVRVLLRSVAVVFAALLLQAVAMLVAFRVVRSVPERVAAVPLAVLLLAVVAALVALAGWAEP
jgi:hypothetical protein